MASELISSDIISTLIFVSPGFLTIALIGKFYGTTINMKQFEKTVWSLIARQLTNNNLPATSFTY